MIRLPTVYPSKFRIQDSTLDLFTGLLVMGGAVLTAIRTYSTDRGFLVSALVIATGAFCATVLKARRSWIKETKYEPLTEPPAIAGWAQGAYEVIENGLADRVDGHGDLRLTVYRVDYDKRETEPTELEQLIEYVGGSGGTLGRKCSARAGIIGVAARTGKPATASMDHDDPDKFRMEAVRTWGFTEEEARLLSPERHSYAAIPISEGDEGPVVAVVFLDSQSRNLFDDEAVLNLVMAQCGVLAQIIRKCYAKST